MALEQTAPSGKTSAVGDLQKLRIDPSRRADLSARGRSPWPWLFALVLLAGVAALGLWYWKEVLSVPEVATSRVVHVTPTEGNAVLTASGYVVAQRRVILGAKTPRRLVERFVGEGDAVEAGQVLARLDHADVDAQLDQAKAAVMAGIAAVERARAAVTRAEHDEAEARSRVAEATARRDGDARELKRFREAGTAVLRKDLELAETALAVSEAALGSAQLRVRSAGAERAWREKDLAAADAEVESRRAQVAVVEALLEDTVIRAPFSGIVLLKQAEVGESVSPGVVSGQVTSGSIFQVADFDSLEAEVDVNESNLPQVREGQPAAIQVDAIPDRILRGEVRILMPGANRQKAAVAVKVRFVDRDPRLRPELGCKVTFLREAAASQASPKLFVPRSAVRPRGAAHVVFLLRDGFASARSVELGEEAGDRVEIRAGLAEGDEVIVAGPQDLSDSTRVRRRR